MATFQKRSGNWRAIITKRGYPRQTKTFNTKSEAENWATTIESEMVRGLFVPLKEAENTTLEEALDRYDREVIPAKKGAKQESMRIRIWKRSTLAKRSLASIQGKDIAVSIANRARSDRTGDSVALRIRSSSPGLIRRSLPAGILGARICLTGLTSPPMPHSLTAIVKTWERTASSWRTVFGATSLSRASR